jgi:proteasome lid subunit RPN8/RPN11
MERASFPILDLTGDEPAVITDAQAIIDGHLRAAQGRPAAGILIGRRSGGVVTVERVVPAARVEDYSGEPAFTPEVWQAVYANLVPGDSSMVIGWYHAHAGGGVELSAYDRSLHEVLFRDPATVALLVDPDSGDRRWFGWQLGVLGAEQQVARPRSPGRARWWMAGALAAMVLAGAIGYGVAAAGRGRRDAQRRSAALAGTLATEATRAQRLTRALARSDADLASVRAELDAERTAVDAARRRAQDAEARLRRLRDETAHRATIVRYRVQPGDSLAVLAAAFYGDQAQWPRIFGPNRSLIADPARLPIGLVLRVPIDAP